MRDRRQAVLEAARVAEQDPLPVTGVGVRVVFDRGDLLDMILGDRFFHLELFDGVDHPAAAAAGDVKIDLADKIGVERLDAADRAEQVAAQRVELLVEVTNNCKRRL
jgi:hypothetical protein